MFFLFRDSEVFAFWSECNGPLENVQEQQH